MTVAELGERMSSGEFAAWMDYAAEEPFGPLREDERAGVIAATLANPYREKGRKPFTPGDFFPELRGPEPPTPPIRQKVRAVLMAAPGNRKPRRGKP